MDLQQKFAQIERVSIDFYGQRQLTYMMKSNFFERALKNSKFSIQEFVHAKELPDLNSSIDPKDVAAFDNIMCRA